MYHAAKHRAVLPAHCLILSRIALSRLYSPPSNTASSLPAATRKARGSSCAPLIWRSVAALDAPVLNKKTKEPTGVTYAQKMEEELVKFEAKQAAGATAGSNFGSPKPSNFFSGGAAG